MMTNHFNIASRGLYCTLKYNTVIILGDGNLHLNICSPQFSSELLAKIEPFVFEWVNKHNGSISAEHGIGFKKTKFLKFSKSDAAIRTMSQIKKMMDPKGILNPYKVLPLELS